MMSDFNKQIYQWHNLTKLIYKPQLVWSNQEYFDSWIRDGFYILMIAFNVEGMNPKTQSVTQIL